MELVFIAVERNEENRDGGNSVENQSVLVIVSSKRENV
jgi:hypothetical protein